MAEIPTPTTGFVKDDGKKNRPLGITVLSLLLILGALSTLMSSAGSFLIYGPIYGGTYLAIAIVNLIIGIALFQLLPWSRMAAIVMQLIGVVMGFIVTAWMGSIIDAILPGSSMFLYMAMGPSIIISLIVVAYLMQGSVKAAFESGEW